MTKKKQFGEPKKTSSATPAKIPQERKRIPSSGLIQALPAPQADPHSESGEPGGGRGRLDNVSGSPQRGVRIDPDIMEGRPGYEESGTSEIIPAERLAGKTTKNRQRG